MRVADRERQCGGGRIHGGDLIADGADRGGRVGRRARLRPDRASLSPLGPRIATRLASYGARYFVPFSSMHRYQREDSAWARAHTTQLADYRVRFEAKGRFRTVDLEHAETFGVGEITEFTWKDLFDTYNCTECGRCTSRCPANMSGKELDPKLLILHLQERILEESLHQFVRFQYEAAIGIAARK